MSIPHVKTTIDGSWLFVSLVLKLEHWNAIESYNNFLTNSMVSFSKVGQKNLDRKIFCTASICPACAHILYHVSPRSPLLFHFGLGIWSMTLNTFFNITFMHVMYNSVHWFIASVLLFFSLATTLFCKYCVIGVVHVSDLSCTSNTCIDWKPTLFFSFTSIKTLFIKWLHLDYLKCIQLFD